MSPPDCNEENKVVTHQGIGMITTPKVSTCLGDNKCKLHLDCLFPRKISNGHFAVIYQKSSTGPGWYSLLGIRALLFDPQVVEFVENNSESCLITHYCLMKYNMMEDLIIEQNGFGEGLALRWVPVGTKFRINVEFDGKETVVLFGEDEWID